MKNDITPPPSSRSRGRIQPPVRANVEPLRTTNRPGYVNRTRVISDIITKPSGEREEIVIVETTPVLETAGEYAPRSVERLSRQDKLKVMERMLVMAQKEAKRERRKKVSFRRLSIAMMAAILLLSTGYVGFDTTMTNNRNKADAAGPETSTTTQTSAVVGSASTAEGSDKTPLPAKTLANYAVAASLPRALYISKLGIAARTLPMSVNSDGSVQAPTNIYDSGWYSGSVQPGEIGAMFIDGHSSGSTHQGLFGNLDKLSEGDMLQIEKGDGARLSYKVVHTETVKLSDVDMKKVLLPYGNALRGLNLMTCAGNWTDHNTTMDQRVIVYTEQV